MPFWLKLSCSLRLAVFQLVWEAASTPGCLSFLHPPVRMAAPFILITNDDLHGDWKLDVHQSHLGKIRRKVGFEVRAMVAVEVPDLRPFIAWQQWMAAQDSEMVVCRTALVDFVQARGRAALEVTCRALYATGKPALLWMRMFTNADGVPIDQSTL